jgi:hypothetical protein
VKSVPIFKMVSPGPEAARLVALNSTRKWKGNP